MKLILDTADLSAIKTCYDYYPVSGVTTNPAILARAGRDFREVLTDIRAFIGPEADLHVQVTAENTADMLKEAEAILSKFGENTFIKVPMTREGIRAIKALVYQEANVTATTVYTLSQAYLAAEAGATYVAPYVNRIDNLGEDGVQLVCKMQDMLETNGYETEILAASFKNVRQVMDLAAYGIGAGTVAPDILEAFLTNATADAAVKEFNGAFHKAFGEKASLL